MSKRLPSNLLLSLSVVMICGLVAVTASNRGGREGGRAANAKSVGVIRARKTQTTMPSPLAGQSATLLPDGRWLLVGGRTADGELSRAALFNPRTGATDALAGNLVYARSGHTATLLPDGNVFIWGGVGADGKLRAQGELFLTQTQTFVKLDAAGLTPRTEHSTTLLTDGRVLIVGGLDERGRVLSSSELWNPRTGIAVALPSKLQSARRGHAAMLLAGGGVLLSGGVGSDGNELRDAEQYEPESARFSSTVAPSGGSDSAAPYLNGSLPEDGDADVPPDALIALRFSKPLQVNTVNSETLTLTGAEGNIVVAVVPAEGGRLAFITPAKRLMPATTYSVTLANARDEFDQPVAPASLTFTTAADAVHEHKGEHDHMQAPVDAQGGVAPAADSWTPDAARHDHWRTGRPDSPLQQLTPLRAAPGVTALAGQVLGLSGQPLAGVTLDIGGQAARTDATGRFLLAPLEGGRRQMLINGYTASKPGSLYGTFEVQVEVSAGRTNVLSYTIWLPVIDTRHATRLSLPTVGALRAANPDVPGLEIHIPSDSVLRYPEHGHHAPGVLDSLTITPIPTDRTPFPVPVGLERAVGISLQLHGAHVEGLRGEPRPGLRIIYPNSANLPPNSRADFWNYDAGGPGWYVYGHGTVTPDGRQVVPDEGTELQSMHCFSLMGPSGIAPNDGPPPGGSSSDGDPVDLSTGLFVYLKTDLALPDVMPVALARTYRQSDTISRAFGLGTTHPYEMFIVGDTYNYADLVLPDGGRIHYNHDVTRTDGAWGEHTATPTAFYKSTISWNTSRTPAGWDIKLRSGSVLEFYTKGAGFAFKGEARAVLQDIKDRFGNHVRIIRDTGHPEMRILKLVTQNGRWIEFTHDTTAGYTNRVVAARDNIGRTVSYTYDATGRLWKVTDPNNGVTEYTYNASHQMVTIKDARGIVYLTNEYDANGRIKKQTQADNSTYQFTYTLDAFGKVMQTDVTDPRANVRRVTFNSAGYALTDTFALGKPEAQTITYERQALTNLVTSVNDPLNRKTTYTYDAGGNVATVTRMADTNAAATTSFTFEPPFNQLKTVTDPLQHTTTFGYDSRGLLTSMTDPLNHQTTLGYNAAGQIISATDALQHTTQFIYDAGDLVEVRDPLGHSSTQYKDGAGRTIRVTNPHGQTTRFEYDGLNQLKKIVNQLQGTTTFNYDPNGNLLSLTDARNGVTSYTYNNMDRVETRTDALHGASSVSQYEYDAAGNLTKFTDRRAKVTSYSYDSLNRLKFAGFGTLINGGTTTYESSINYTYDAANRLQQALDSASGTITRTYDDVARTMSETAPLGTVGYTFDAAGRLSGQNVSGQSSISYGYDNANRLTAITQGLAAISFGYDDANRRTSLTLPNSLVVESGYDDASRLTSLTYKQGGSVLGDLSYEYDLAGRRTKMGGGFARNTAPPPLASATHNAANQLTQRGAATLTYDANGNLTSDGENVYTWDARNQLASISGAVTASFQYDALGRRTSKSLGGQTTGYLYSGANVVQEQVGGAATANLLTGGVDEVFSRSETTGIQSLLHDGLGSTLALTDAAGALQTQYSYEAFGATVSTGAASGHAGQYTGRENDGTGLYYYRARYYSPLLQRFISEDPIGFSGGTPDLYKYVLNSPTNFRDPTGLVPDCTGQKNPEGLMDANNAGESANNGIIHSIYERGYSALTLLMADVGPRGVGKGIGGVPAASEMAGTLELGPQLYDTVDKIRQRQDYYDDAERAAHGDWTPRKGADGNFGYGPCGGGYGGGTPGSGTGHPGGAGNPGEGGQRSPSRLSGRSSH